MPRRVLVRNADGSGRILAYGEYLGEFDMRQITPESIPEMWAKELKTWLEFLEEHEDLSYDTPKIKLDSGEIIYGFMCWWEDAPSAS